MSYDIGQNIVIQKTSFVGKKNGPINSKNVCYIVDLSYLPRNEKELVIKNILQGASDKGSKDGIFFLNK